MSGTRFQMQRIPILSDLFDLVGKDGRVPAGSERLRRLLDGSTAATVRPDPDLSPSLPLVSNSASTRSRLVLIVVNIVVIAVIVVMWGVLSWRRKRRS